MRQHFKEKFIFAQFYYPNLVTQKCNIFPDEWYLISKVFKSAEKTA